MISDDQADGSKILNQKLPWDKNANPIWLASSVSLRRNIEKYKFPAKLDADRKKQIISLVGKELLSFEGLKNPYLVKGEELGFLGKEFLIEHFLSIENYNQANLGEAFILDVSGEFLATLNMNDHIYLSMIDCKGELENTWNKLVKIETMLGKSLNYSFLPKFGFLTADPTGCGTALNVSIYLQLPALVHTGKIDDFLEANMDDSLLITGIQGSPSEIIGDVLVLQNNYTLGLTEENIISSLRTMTTKLIVEENSARGKVMKDEDPGYKDKVARSYGILIHSYQIEAIEALNAISLIKLGAQAGWITGIDNQKLNELFFNCRRAHLLSQFSDQKMSQEEIPHRRAEYIHKAMKDVKLII